MANVSNENQMKQIRKRDLATISKKIKTSKANVQKYYKKLTECCKKLDTLMAQYGKAKTEAKAKSIKYKMSVTENSRKFAERLHATSVAKVQYWQGEYGRAKCMPINQKYIFREPF